jgi:peptidoglycan/LPS O-acetylase OafA/YrhL
MSNTNEHFHKIAGNISLNHIPILDGIRAYAVLMVCIFHFFMANESGIYENNKILGIFLFKTSELGKRGVELFFILSGFLITGILLDTKKSLNYFKTFYARRFLRIFPLYYFVLFISFAILPLILTIDVTAAEIIKKQSFLWTYTSNLASFWGKGGWDAGTNFPWFVHFWSLCVEEHFYLLWPLMIYYIDEKILPKIMWAIIVVSALSFLFSSVFPNIMPVLGCSSIVYAGVLSLGGLIAIYHRNQVKLKKKGILLRKYILLTGILLFIVNFIPRKFALNEILTLFLSVLFFVQLLVISLNGSAFASKILNHKKLFFIGKISYGIYVYHGLLVPFLNSYLYKAILSSLHNAFIASIIHTVISTCISIALAWVSWEIFERKFLSFKKYFAY